jgi:tRNA-specific 2-thiouridylase
VGELEKSEVRHIARKAGLHNHNKKDSQGLCFVGEIRLSEFLSVKVPERKGDIVDEQGRVVGRHRGIAYYTDGQRTGLGLGGMKEPHFVARRNASTNTLVVAKKDSPLLYGRTLTLRNVRFANGEITGAVSAKIRYRQEDQTATLAKEGEEWVITFSEPQYAPSRGQSVVCYRGDELVCGGIIKDVEQERVPQKEAFVSVR